MSAEKDRELFVTCSKGACQFWASVVNEQGEAESLTEDLIGRFAGIHI